MNLLRASVVAIIFYGILFAGTARAQSAPAYLWITWRATTYVPPESNARALPIENSKIVAALDLVENGRPVSLANQTIYWYVNDELLTSGFGMTRVSVPVSGSAGQSFTLRASLPDFEGGLAKSVTIPVANPLAVIRAEAPGGVARSSPFTVRAKPYFFDITSPDELAVDWKVNGVAPQTYNDPFTLNITLDSSVTPQSSITFALRLTNPAKVLEFATDQSTVLFQP